MRRINAIRRALLALAAFGAVLVIGLVAEQVARVGGGMPVTSDLGLEADLTLSGFRMEEVGPEGPLVALSARTARLLEENRRITAEGLNVTFFDHGVEAARLSARSGEVSMDGGQVTVHGTAANPARMDLLTSGLSVQSVSLDWDPEQRIVHSAAATTLRQDGLVATGRSLSADVDAQTVTLSDGVEVQWAP